jgi:histidine triad (HIT) family protein
MSTPCIFCSIVSGQLPASKVYETDRAVAFLDIRPINSGHVLVLPKTHYATLKEVPADLAQHLLDVVVRVEKALWNVPGLACEGTNILQNNGPAAGQDVFHVHFHVVPRHTGDGFKFRYQAQRPERAQLDALAAEIAAAVAES